MMSAPTRLGTISRDINLEDLRPRLRLRLKPKGPSGGQVDGGWWPRSRDLAAELPSLLAVLAVRLGRIERLTYHLTDWSPAPRKITGRGGGVVRLGGYRTQPACTVNVLAGNHRITLLVVPPQTPPQNAHAALMAAGRRGNTDGVEALLGACMLTPQLFDGERESALERWELDGGHGR